jgi:glutathione peroxidase-family protein
MALLDLLAVASRRLVTMAGSFYDIVEKDAAGKDVNFSKFKGKVLYGVNVASRCGYTGKLPCIEVWSS